jgi:hypothetical protein
MLDSRSLPKGPAHAGTCTSFQYIEPEGIHPYLTSEIPIFDFHVYVIAVLQFMNPSYKWIQSFVPAIFLNEDFKDLSILKEFD